jgi:hypothetical protein
MPNYNSALFDAATEEFGSAPSKTWAGQSDDAFFLDLRVFDLLYGANLTEVGDDTLAGFNVNTLALQVPKTDLALSGDAEANPIIGIWSTTSRRSTTIQVQRRVAQGPGQVRAGVPSRHAARERGRDPGGAEGLLQLLRSPRPTARPCRSCRTRSCRTC